MIRRRGWMQWLRRLAWLLVLLELAYLAAGNAFLRTPWGPSLLDRRPEKLQITWRDAWTPLPGLVRAHGVDVRGRTPKLSWRVAVDDAWLWLAPLDLIRRQFHLYRLEVGGLETQVHFDRKAPTGQTDIEGFEGLPAPVRRESKRRWRIDFDRVSVRGIRELWFGPLRYRADDPDGGGTATGRLRAQVRGTVAVPWAEIELAPGRATAGDELIGDVTHIAMIGRLDPFVPQEVQGIAKLAFLSGTFEAATTGGSLGLVDYFFRGAPASVHGTGRLDTVLHLERGVLQPRSTLRVEDGSVRVTYLGWHGEGRGLLLGGVDSQGTTQLRVDFDEVEFGLHRVAEHLVVSHGASLVADATRFDLSETTPELRVVAELPDSQIAQLARFQAFLPTHAQVELLGGSGTVSGQATLITGSDPNTGDISATVTGGVRIRGQRIDLKVRDNPILADLELDVEVPHGDLVVRRLDIGGSRLRLSRVQVADGDRDWWADLRVSSGSVRLPQEGSVVGSAVEARIEADLADSRPLMALVVERLSSLGWFERLLTFENLSLKGEVRTVRDGVEFRDLEVRDRGDGTGTDKDLRLLSQVRFDESGYEALLRASMKIAVVNVAAGLHVHDGQILELDLWRSLEWYRSQSATFWQDPTLTEP